MATCPIDRPESNAFPSEDQKSWNTFNIRTQISENNAIAMYIVRFWLMSVIL